MENYKLATSTALVVPLLKQWITLVSVRFFELEKHHLVVRQTPLNLVVSSRENIFEPSRVERKLFTYRGKFSRWTSVKLLLAADFPSFDVCVDSHVRASFHCESMASNIRVTSPTSSLRQKIVMCSEMRFRENSRHTGSRLTRSTHRRM